MVDKAVIVSFTTDQLIGVELDEVRHLEVYGSLRTQFQYGEKCYFRLYPYPIEMVLTITVSDGIISDEGSGIEIVTDEIITFSGSASAQTNKPIKELTAYSWLGPPQGEPTFIGKILTIPDPVAGVMKISYTTDFVRKAISIGVKRVLEYSVVVLISGELEPEEEEEEEEP